MKTVWGRALSALGEAPGLARIVRAGLGILIGIVFIWILLKNVDLREAWRLILTAAWLPLTIALLAFAADFLLRAVRFWIMLRIATSRAIPFAPTIAPFISSFGISDILPLRAGDAFRIYWFHRQFDIPVGTMIGAMIIERLFDLLSIIMIGAVALEWVGPTAPPKLIAIFQTVLVVGFGAGLFLLLAPAMLSRLAERFLGSSAEGLTLQFLKTLKLIADAIGSMGSWRLIASLFALSALLWVIESIVFLSAWISLGGALGEWHKPFLAFTFATLGTLVPGLPGHFGTFEYFGVQAFTLTGVSASYAAAVTFIAHMVLWAPTALFAAIWLLMAFSSPQTKSKI